jgi:glycerol-3-phosphate dehydrogenase (NAD(P)+)
MNRRPISILGAGAWGSALAHVMRQNGTQVTMWDCVAKPGVLTSLQQAVHPECAIVLAISVQQVYRVCEKMIQDGVQPAICWIASKGLDLSTGTILSQVVQKYFPNTTIGVFSGPNIAREVHHNQHCGMTLACQDPTVLRQGQDLFMGTTLHIDTSSDVIGVQWWGALKNIIAIGYGILQQSDVGYNMSATFLTCAIRELATIIKAKGGQAETTFSFAGIGDLILTSHCPAGRNRAYGQSFPQEPTCLVEGLDTLNAFWNHTIQSPEWRVSTPIIRSIWAVLNQKIDVASLSKCVIDTVSAMDSCLSP